jgi:hypothetical protein
MYVWILKRWPNKVTVRWIWAGQDLDGSSAPENSGIVGSNRTCRMDIFIFRHCQMTC